MVSYRLFWGVWMHLFTKLSTENVDKRRKPQPYLSSVEMPIIYFKFGL